MVIAVEVIINKYFQNWKKWWKGIRNNLLLINIITLLSSQKQIKNLQKSKKRIK